MEKFQLFGKKSDGGEETAKSIRVTDPETGGVLGMAGSAKEAAEMIRRNSIDKLEAA